MKKAILSDIEKLLAENKQDEARSLLREALSAPLSEEERGALLVGFAAAYLALSNHIKGERVAALEEEVGALEEIDSISKNIDKAMERVNARSNLNK